MSISAEYVSPLPNLVASFPQSVASLPRSVPSSPRESELSPEGKRWHGPPGMAVTDTACDVNEFNNVAENVVSLPHVSAARGAGPGMLALGDHTINYNDLEECGASRCGGCSRIRGGCSGFCGCCSV